MTAPLQLLLYFFLYAFLGWCAEVAFAAVTTRQLVNRGFLNGPQCPIYGFGMVALLVTLGPWRQNLPAVFFGSMVLATLVELVGGWLLYRLFHTRWWDYTNQRWNLGGYICPKFSLLWGLGGAVMLTVVHPLLARPVQHIPRGALLAVDLVLLAGFLADTAISFAQAAGLTRQLRSLDELGSGIRRLSDRMTEHIGTRAMTVDTLLDEQKLQLMLAAMEGRDNAAALREQLLELAARAGAQRQALEKLARQRYFGAGRLLRAFPHMQVPDHAEAVARLRTATARLTRQLRGPHGRPAAEIRKGGREWSARRISRTCRRWPAWRPGSGPGTRRSSWPPSLPGRCPAPTPAFSSSWRERRRWALPKPTGSSASPRNCDRRKGGQRKRKRPGCAGAFALLVSLL